MMPGHLHAKMALGAVLVDGGRRKRRKCLCAGGWTKPPIRG